MVNNKVRVSHSQYVIEINLSRKPNTCHYTIKNQGKTFFMKEGDLPLSLGINTNIGKEIKKCIDPDGRLTKDALKDDYSTLMIKLHEKYEALVDAEKEEHQRIVEEEQENLALNKINASDKLKNIDEPLIYIASLVDWVTAGERSNIMLTFLAYISQIVLKNPVSVICLGESSSGKTHIQEKAMDLIPSEYIINEKKITESALFNRAKKDEYFYDGKIVNYGDMGGDNDQKFMEDSKALMKELQSEGYLNKPLNIPAPEGGWEVVDLKLKGKPCLTYTTVPNHCFDDQELSRSIFVTPRMDNKLQFESMLTSLEIKGKSYNSMLKYSEEIKNVKYMIYDLKDKLEDIVIINPYSSILVDYLSSSKYYKRDYSKYDSLIKTITALNYYTRTVHNINGRKTMYCSLKDIQYFMSIMNPYKLSIVSNLSPKATDILQELIELSEDDKESLIFEFSIPSYFEVSVLNLSKRSLYRYFEELNEEGYINQSTKKGNEIFYTLSTHDFDDSVSDLKLDDKALEQLKYELSDEELNIILDDKLPECEVSVHDQFEGITPPPWRF